MSTESLFEARFKTDSWHRRLVEYIFSHDYFYEHLKTGSMYVHRAKPVSLCKYFWSVNLAIVSLPFVALYRAIPKGRGRQIRLGISLAVFVLLGVFQSLTGHFLWFLYGLGILGAIMLLVLGAAFLSEFIGDRDFFRRFSEWWNKDTSPPKPPKQEKPKQPNIYWQYIAARKKKICPIIRWE